MKFTLKHVFETTALFLISGVAGFFTYKAAGVLVELGLKFPILGVAPHAIGAMVLFSWFMYLNERDAVAQSRWENR